MRGKIKEIYYQEQKPLYTSAEAGRAVRDLPVFEAIHGVGRIRQSPQGSFSQVEKGKGRPQASNKELKAVLGRFSSSPRPGSPLLKRVQRM